MTAEPKKSSAPNPENGADPPPPPQRRERRKHLFDGTFWRDGAVTMIATFLGAGLAFWLSQVQADRQDSSAVSSTLGYLQDDCRASLTELREIKITDGPVMVTTTTTLLTLATNPTFMKSVEAEARGKLLPAIYAANRSGNAYNLAATQFDSFMKLHAAEFERLQHGDPVLLPFPGPQSMPPVRNQDPRQQFENAQAARRADLTAERNRLLNQVRTALNLVVSNHQKLCDALMAGSDHANAADTGKAQG